MPGMRSTIAWFADCHQRFNVLRLLLTPIKITKIHLEHEAASHHALEWLFYSERVTELFEHTLPV